MMPRLVRAALAAVVVSHLVSHVAPAQGMPSRTPARPFGTMKEQAALQQQWLAKRLDTFLPALMRKHRVDLWVVPMREYNEDPIFSAIVAPTTFAARRRTIYVFFDKCAAGGVEPSPTCDKGIERVALGGGTQGGVFTARASTKTVIGSAGPRQAEVWGDEQWGLLKTVIEERNPRTIAINSSTVFAFTDGLTSGELAGMSTALGPRWSAKFRPAEGLALELLASRLPEETELRRPLGTERGGHARELAARESVREREDGARVDCDRARAALLDHGLEQSPLFVAQQLGLARPRRSDHCLG